MHKSFLPWHCNHEQDVILYCQYRTLATSPSHPTEHNANPDADTPHASSTDSSDRLYVRTNVVTGPSYVSQTSLPLFDGELQIFTRTLLNEHESEYQNSKSSVRVEGKIIGLSTAYVGTATAGA